MSEFTDDQITSMAQVAETELAAQTKAIIERYSFAVIKGQAEISLGSNILEIMRVFWKGKRLRGSRTTTDLINSNSVPYSSEQGLPVEYLVDFIGIPIIRLYPAPNETLSAGVGDLWSPTNIENCFIVECAISPTFTSSELRVPSWMRRQYVKDYVLYRLLKREGKAMDLKASEYFKNKFKMGLTENAIIREQLFSCIPQQFQPVISTGYKVARPVLPSNFGTVCG